SWAMLATRSSNASAPQPANTAFRQRISRPAVTPSLVSANLRPSAPASMIALRASCTLGRLSPTSHNEPVFQSDSRSGLVSCACAVPASRPSSRVRIAIRVTPIVASESAAGSLTLLAQSPKANGIAPGPGDNCNKSSMPGPFVADRPPDPPVYHGTELNAEPALCARH